MALTITRRLRLLAVGGLIALSLAAPIAASADTGGPGIAGPYSNKATATVMSVTYESKLLVNVRISVVCDPLEAFDWNTGQNILITDGQTSAAATILQAQGRTIVGSTGFAAKRVTCDSTTVNELLIPVTASSLPFRKGDAAAGTQLDVCEVPFGQCWASASSGPVMVRLGR